MKIINVLIYSLAGRLSYAASFHIQRYHKWLVICVKTFLLLRSRCVPVNYLLYWPFIEWAVQLQLLACFQVCKFAVCSEIEKVNLIANFL